MQKALTRGVEDIHVRTHLEAALRSGRKLRVKLGIDPTSPDLHLGHTVVLRKLRQFQDLGHKAVLIIGDFTAQIGDPSGRSETRKPLEEAEVKQNLKTYLAQAGKVIDLKHVETRFNSEWHQAKGLSALLTLAGTATVQQILKRDDFEKRFEEDSDISILETLYPLLQGYDSVAVKADVELGGTDQTFNLLMGRQVQRRFGMPEQDVVTVPLIEGTDGVKKMSKSYKNYIALTETPGEMFGKLMRVPDALLPKYFETLTDFEPPHSAGPREQKLFLAEAVVGMYHTPAAARAAREDFIRVFSRGEAPARVPELRVAKPSVNILELLLEAGIPSRSEARRLVEQGGIEIDDVLKRDPLEVVALRGGEVLKIGKHRFFKLLVK